MLQDTTGMCSGQYLFHCISRASGTLCIDCFPGRSSCILGSDNTIISLSARKPRTAEGVEADGSADGRGDSDWEGALATAGTRD